MVPLWVSRTTDGNTVLQSSSPFFFFNILAGLHANHSKQWDTVPEQAMAQRLREQVPSLQSWSERWRSRCRCAERRFSSADSGNLQVFVRGMV